MSEITNRFCESVGFTEITLNQYGRYTGEADKPQLPFLTENVIVTYVTAGSGMIKLGNAAYAAEEDMVIVFFPGICINCTGMAGHDSEALWMELSGEALMSSLLRAGLTPQKPVYKITEEHNGIKDLFLKLTDPNEEYSPLRATGYALELLDGLIQQSPRPGQPKPANLQQHYVDKSIRFIEAKYPQDISVEDVAQYCGLNRSYLGKLFRDTTGMTTQEYLIRHRMKIACKYLERAAAPIATIARSVGYPNQLHFSRAFHKVFEIPPREWQKRNRKI